MMARASSSRPTAAASLQHGRRLKLVGLLAPRDAHACRDAGRPARAFVVRNAMGTARPSSRSA